MKLTIAMQATTVDRTSPKTAATLPIRPVIKTPHPTMPVTTLGTTAMITRSVSSPGDLAAVTDSATRTRRDHATQDILSALIVRRSAVGHAIPIGQVSHQDAPSQRLTVLPGKPIWISVTAILAGWMCEASRTTLGLGSLKLSAIRAVVASDRTGGLSETGRPG